MLAGALTDSPMWLPTALYWVAWALAHAVWWWVSTATRNMEAIAPAASIVYWLAVWYSFAVASWGWTKTKTVYGIREAVDFGEGTRSLGRFPRRMVQGQTRLRVFVATYGLAVGGLSCALLLAVGIAGAWSIPLAVGWAVVRVNRARRRARLVGP